MDGNNGYDSSDDFVNLSLSHKRKKEVSDKTGNKALTPFLKVTPNFEMIPEGSVVQVVEIVHPGAEGTPTYNSASLVWR